MNQHIRYYPLDKKKIINFIIQNWFLSPFIFLVFTIASISTLHPLYMVDWYNEKRLIQILLLISLTLTTLFSKKIREKFYVFFNKTPIWIKACLFIMVILGFFSSIFSEFPRYSYLELSLIFLLFAFFIYISICKQHLGRDFEKIVISAFVLSAAAYAIAFISSIIAAINFAGLIEYRNLIVGFLNIRFLNQFQSISFPILILASFIFFNNKKSLQAVLVIIAAFWFMLMIITKGRGVILATFMGIIISGFLFPLAKIIWWKRSAVIILSGATLYYLLMWLFSNYTVLEGDLFRTTSSSRIDLWLNAIELSKKSLLLGNGGMHYGLQPHSTTHAHPHNISFQFVSEWGIPVTILTFCTLLYVFIRWVKYQRTLQQQKPEEINLVPVALTSAFIAALIHGQFSGVFVMPLSQLSFVLISGWMMGMKNEPGPVEKKSVNNIYHSLSLIITSVFFSCMLIYGILPQLPHLKVIELDIPNVYLDGEYPARDHPRFWLKTIVNK